MIQIKLFIRKVLGIYKVWNNNKISKTSFIARNVQFLGISNIEIGTNCTIGESTTFTVNDRHDKKVRLKIGKNTYIGRDNFFSVGKAISIGDYCIFGNNCSFLGSNHKFDTPLVPYALSGSTLDKKISIGVNCWFGINSTIIGDVNIGHGCIIGANTIVTKNIPPFSMVVGNPARIIKRYDFDLGRWVSNLAVPECEYFKETVYLKYINDKFGNVSLAYHSSSSIFGNV